MRTKLLICCLAVVACSDSTAPPEFLPAPGTYALSLSACAGCDVETTSAFALQWREGFRASLELSQVSGTGAKGRFLTLEAADGSDLVEGLVPATVRFRRVSGGGLRTVTGYVLGEVHLTLEPDGGCTFELSYPTAGTQPGACQLQFNAGVE